MPERRVRAFVICGAVAVIGISIAVTAAQQPARTGPFTAEQAASGRAIYQSTCSTCHLPDMKGTFEAPPLAGANFMNMWRNRPMSDLFSRIKNSMPITNPGSLTATLAGKQLTIQGTFEGLRSPATTIQIHRAPKGIPGPIIPNLELTVTKTVKGAVSGTLELTPDQIADLRNGLWYVQIQSERAPDGNLWGWLLK